VSCGQPSNLAGRWEGLDGFCDFAASQTTRTDSDTFRRSINDSANALQVGIERTLGLVIRMADVMTALVFLGANIAYKCHGKTPSLDLSTKLTLLT
jgi:hypothetical protein